jgi:hypothetical protein
MPITIKKGGSTQRSAPVVEGALKAEPAPPPAPKTKAEVKDSWLGVPSHTTKPTQCDFCKQWYIKPCDAEKSKGCLNFLHLKGKAA